MTKKRLTAATAETAPAVAAVPDPPVPDGAVRVRLDGGRYVDMSRELDGEDYLLLWRLQELDVSDRTALLAMYGPIMQMLTKHVVSHNLGGPILRRPLPELLQIWKEWNRLAESEALDPTPAGA